MRFCVVFISGSDTGIWQLNLKGNRHEKSGFINFHVSRIKKRQRRESFLQNKAQTLGLKPLTSWVWQLVVCSFTQVQFKQSNLFNNGCSWVRRVVQKRTSASNSSIQRGPIEAFNYPALAWCHSTRLFLINLFFFNKLRHLPHAFLPLSKRNCGLRKINIIIPDSCFVFFFLLKESTEQEHEEKWKRRGWSQPP